MKKLKHVNQIRYQLKTIITSHGECYAPGNKNKKMRSIIPHI